MKTIGALLLALSVLSVVGCTSTTYTTPAASTTYTAPGVTTTSYTPVSKTTVSTY